MGAAFRRVIVKVSGEALTGPDPFGLHQGTLSRIASDIVAARALGAAIGVVIGGGNIVRGAEAANASLSRPSADTMGMLATVINAIALESAIAAAGAPVRTFSALAMPSVCEQFSRQRALKELDEGRVVLLAAGTGNPLFTTDTAAVLRAVELHCDAMMKATNVDGVYDADPKQNPKATRYERLTHDEALARDLKVMDATAFALARENRMPIIVFSIREPGSLAAVLGGKGRSTVVGALPVP